MKQKQKFIRSTISKTEIRDILEEMNCGDFESNFENDTISEREYEECVETLSHCTWTPTEDQIRRNERLRATPIEHDDDDDEKIVEFTSDDSDYLSSRPIEELKQWLEQHQIQHNEQSKRGLVSLVSRMFRITTPARVMPKFKLCGKSSRATRTRSVRKTLMKKEKISMDIDSEDDDDDEMDNLQLKLVFTT